MRLIGLGHLLVVLIAASAWAGEQRDILPLGHPDFYPSSERPVGWRGDGSGAWPGASPVREWSAATGKNIIWKTAMPGPSFSQPVVVGDKVFTLADPNWLICLSAVDGRILWQKAVDQTSVMPPQEAAKAREEISFWNDLFSQYAIWADIQHNYTPKLPQSRIDQAMKAADAHEFAINGPGEANFWMIARHDPLWERCNADESNYSIYAFGHWEGLLTHTFATPVSDGRNVFVNMANDQVGCFDLNGNCQWQIRDRPAEAKPAEMHVRYAMSPRLIGDKLIVAACGELRAYDKLTGKKLWGVSSRDDFGNHWVKVGTPVCMRLMLDGKPFDVLLSPGSGIYRISDGKMVGSLPEMKGYEGATALTDGQMYIRKDAPDNNYSVRLAGKFKAVSSEQVVFEEAWRKTSPRLKGANNASDILFNGLVYSPQEGRTISVADGKAADLPVTRPQLCSPALGGKVLVTLHGGGYGYREKTPGFMTAEVFDIDNPAKLSTFDAAFVDRRFEEDEAYRLRWRWRGNGDSMSNSSPSFQANRMFFRTVGYLWCVGDPQQTWPTPANAPAEARVK